MVTAEFMDNDKQIHVKEPNLYSQKKIQKMPQDRL